MNKMSLGGFFVASFLSLVSAVPVLAEANDAAKIGAVIYMQQTAPTCRNYTVKVRYDGGDGNISGLEISNEPPLAVCVNSANGSERNVVSHVYSVQTLDVLNADERKLLEGAFNDLRQNYQQVIHTQPLPLNSQGLAAQVLSGIAALEPSFAKFEIVYDANNDQALSPIDWLTRYQFLGAVTQLANQYHNLIDNQSVEGRKLRSEVATSYSAAALKVQLLRLQKLAANEAAIPENDSFFEQSIFVPSKSRSATYRQAVDAFKDAASYAVEQLKRTNYVVNQGEDVRTMDYTEVMKVVMPAEMTHQDLLRGCGPGSDEEHECIPHKGWKLQSGERQSTKPATSPIRSSNNPSNNGDKGAKTAYQTPSGPEPVWVEKQIGNQRVRVCETK